ncbi:MAG: hypothetical protein ACK4VN_15920 [Bacteroidales bacterium]
MTAQIGDTIIYQGKPYTMYGFLPILLPEFTHRYDVLFQWKTTACWRGCISTWEIADDKLYWVAVDARAKLTDKHKYREEKLRLRKLLRQGEITPVQNGHMLKAYYQQITFEKEVDVAFLYGKPAPVFADWITTIIPFSIRVEDERFKNSPSGFQFFRTLYLHVKEGILVETSFEKPGNTEEDSCPWGHHPEERPEYARREVNLFSEEQWAQYKEEVHRALKNAVFKISPFRLGNDKPC